MEKDDQAARKARAERLRKQIARIINKPDPAPDRDEPDSSQDATSEGDSQSSHKVNESPRDFIQRRMREVKEKRK